MQVCECEIGVFDGKKVKYENSLHYKNIITEYYLSSCGNINNYTNDEMNLVQNSNVSVEKEVSCIANIYKCVKRRANRKGKVWITFE